MSATRPASIGALVSAVRAGVRAARALECALFFVAGCLLARSAALFSPALSGAGGTALPVLLCGLLCAAAWWLEHPLARAQTARALDRRLGYRGALQTALELEERAARGSNAAGWSPMEELVRVQVLERLRFGEALGVCLPSPFLPLAAPVVAGVLLLLVQDSRGVPPSPEREPRALVAGLERALARNELGLEQEGAAELERALLQEVRALAPAVDAAPTGAGESALPPEALRARFAAVDRRLFELSTQVEPGGESARRLAEARAWLDALSSALGARAGEAAPGGSGRGSLTPADADGTISRPHPGDGPGVPPPMSPFLAPDPDPLPTASAPDAALGVQAGSPWPREYDGVVERWIERTRAARERERP